MYDNFAFVVGGALCIIMAGPFIPYPNTYLESISLLPIFYIMITQKTYPLDTYIPHMPEYIPSRCSLYATLEYILVVG